MENPPVSGAPDFARRYLSTIQDLHLLGKVLFEDTLNDAEELAADALFERLHGFLDELVGKDWAHTAALV